MINCDRLLKIGWDYKKNPVFVQLAIHLSENARISLHFISKRSRENLCRFFFAVRAIYFRFSIDLSHVFHKSRWLAEIFLFCFLAVFVAISSLPFCSFLSSNDVDWCSSCDFWYRKACWSSALVCTLACYSQ